MVLGILLILSQPANIIWTDPDQFRCILTPWVQFLQTLVGLGECPVWLSCVDLPALQPSAQPHGTKILSTDSNSGCGRDGLFIDRPAISSWGGNSVDRAAMGEDGGLVGWGLARMGEFLLPGAIEYPCCGWVCWW